MNERKSSEIIEDLINSLEALIDALDDEWHQNKDFHWKKADEIRKTIIPRNKDMFKKYLDEYIDRRIETYKKGKKNV